jgi:hypothetical protein
MDWNSEESQEARDHLNDALVLQFNVVYGTDETNLSSWHKLCRTLQISAMPSTVQSCKEASCCCPALAIACSSSASRESEAFIIICTTHWRPELILPYL